jgi:hypothetical protein
MAPYEPPIAHYTQLNVPDIDEDTMFEFVGKNGYRFYKLTRDLGLRYLWYDKERKAIEVWGSYSSLLKDPCTKLRQSLDEWCKNKCSQESQEGDPEIIDQE